MTGYLDEATLANSNDFISKVSRAMLDWAIGKYYSAEPQTFRVLEQARGIIVSDASDASRIASLIVASNETMQTNAPALPSDASITSALEVVLEALRQ